MAEGLSLIHMRREIQVHVICHDLFMRCEIRLFPVYYYLLLLLLLYFYVTRILKLHVYILDENHKE